MADAGPSIDVAKAIADPLATIVGWLAGLLPEGPARALLYVVVGLCVAAAPFIYRYYLGVLAQGAQPEGSIERQDYDRLRASLAGGNLAARLYADWLARFLDAVERFFGDKGMADRTLFPRAFGLNKPAPLWTAPAFDRCLLLALIYPIAAIFVIWAVSGDVGPAEAALGLPTDVPGPYRALGVAAIGFSSFAFWHAVLTPGWKRQLWMALLLGASAAGFFPLIESDAIAAAVIAAPAGAGVVAVAFNGSRAGAGAGAITVSITVICITVICVVVLLAVVGFPESAAAVTVIGDAVIKLSMAVVFLSITEVFSVTFPVAVAGVFAAAGAGAGAGAVAGAVAYGAGLTFAGELVFFIAGAGTVVFARGALLLNKRAIKFRGQGVFQSLFLPVMVWACLATANMSSLGVYWKGGGPLLLFLGLLTLLNAPFDWASLGLTRALLRRGLELGGWWPYLLALVDAALAVVIIACLALVMVIGVQAFDELAVHGGGEKAAVLPLNTLFDGIAKNPEAPEYWWAYALLLSTMIPSLINLAISGMAFTRGIPGVSRLLLRWIPEGQDVPDYRRPIAAMALTGQMFAGAFLGIAAQAVLAWGLLYHLMPAIGLDLLDMARAVAAFDLPARVGQVFAGLR